MYKNIVPRFTFAINAPFPSTSHKPSAYKGPAYDQVVKDRATYMPNFYFHYYKKPLLINEGYLQYLYDH